MTDNPHSFFVAISVVQSVLTDTLSEITTKQFVKKNQPAYTVHKQNGIINSNLDLIIYSPEKSKDNKDCEPSNINLDNMMKVDKVQQNLSTIIPSARTKKSGTHTQKSQKTFIKQTATPKSRVQTEKSQKYTKLFQLYTQVNQEQEEKPIKIMRLQKQQQERKLRANSQPKKIVPLWKPSRGERAVFDYEGSASKGKDNKRGDFQYTLLSGQPHRDTRINKDIPVISQFLTKQIKASLISKLNQKMTLRKSNNNQANKIDFDNSQVKCISREDMIKSIQIQNPGVKIKFDGQIIQKKKQTNTLNTLNQIKKSYENQLKMIQQNSSRFKTQTIDIDSSQQLSKKSKQSPLRQRIKTQLSASKVSNANTIKYQSLQLRNQIVDDNLQLYKEIPSKAQIRKRIKTNLDDSLIESSEKINRVKFSAVTKFQQRLPKIFKKGIF